MAAAATSVLGTSLTQFGIELPYTKPPYSKRNWGHPLHSLCSYQGKLKPSLAHTLVGLLPSGARVLDPLGGVGTIAFEAASAGHQAWSNDLSPLAYLVCRGKLAPPTHEEAEAAIDGFSERLATVVLDDGDYDAARFGLNAQVADYFHVDTLDEVLRARKLLLAEGEPPPCAAFIWACLLHVLHGNRPYALSRTSHPITPFHPRGPFIRRHVVDSVRQKAQRALAVPLPSAFRPGVSLHGDYRELPQCLSEDVDAIITSPPFLGMRFDRPNWLRLWLCGWTAESFHDSLAAGFLERQQVGSRDCYVTFLRTCHEVLVEHGVLLMHVGSGARGDLAADLRSLASPLFELEADVVEPVPHLERHGLTDKRLTTRHHILAFSRR